MKLRCVHNSIRIRVRKSDVAALRSSGKIAEHIGLPLNAPMGFMLAISDTATGIEVRWEDRLLSVSLPRELALGWIDTDQVGIEQELPLDSGETLHLLIEKDFPCKHRDGEDKADTFRELSGEDGNL